MELADDGDGSRDPTRRKGRARRAMGRAYFWIVNTFDIVYPPTDVELSDSHTQRGKGSGLEGTGY